MVNLVSCLPSFTALSKHRKCSSCFTFWHGAHSEGSVSPPGKNILTHRDISMHILRAVTSDRMNQDTRWHWMYILLFEQQILYWPLTSALRPRLQCPSRPAAVTALPAPVSLPTTAPALASRGSLHPSLSPGIRWGNLICMHTQSRHRSICVLMILNVSARFRCPRAKARASVSSAPRPLPPSHPLPEPPLPSGTGT